MSTVAEVAAQVTDPEMPMLTLADLGVLRDVEVEAGVAPPAHVGLRAVGPVPLTLHAPPETVACPQCGSAATEETSRFGATACTALRRCTACREPFEHMKGI